MSAENRNVQEEDMEAISHMETNDHTRLPTCMFARI